MSAPYIPATALGGDLVRDWTGPADATWLSQWLDGCVLVGGSVGGGLVVVDELGDTVGPRAIDEVRLDPRRPEVAHRIVDVLRAKGHEVGHLLPVSLGGRQGDVKGACPTPDICSCEDNGQPVGHAPIRRTIPATDVSAVLLAASVAGVEAGRGVVRGVLGEWREDHWTHYRDGLDGHQRVWTYIRAGDRAHDGDGWAIGRPTKATPKGPETGPEGRAAADAALLRLGYAYLDPAAPFGVVVPTFDLEKR